MYHSILNSRFHGTLCRKLIHRNWVRLRGGYKYLWVTYDKNKKYIQVWPNINSGPTLIPAFIDQSKVIFIINLLNIGWNLIFAKSIKVILLSEGQLAACNKSKNPVIGWDVSDLQTHASWQYTNYIGASTITSYYPVLENEALESCLPLFICYAWNVLQSLHLAVHQCSQYLYRLNVDCCLFAFMRLWTFKQATNLA